MELESCQNPAHTQNTFCSRITIHTHTKRVLLTHNDSHTHAQCGLQIQNIIHKLMHFASETNTVCFTQSTKKNPSSTQNNSTSTEHWKLRVDRKAFAHGSARRKISAKSHMTNKCPVIHTTQQQVALLSQFKAARTIFFSPQNLYLMPANRVWILWKAKKATNWP